MEFAARVGASTNADVLDYRQPARREADVYRNRAIDELAAQRIVRNAMAQELEAVNELAEEIMSL